MQVEGHSPNDVWQKFPKDGGGWEAWNQSHVGEVIEKQNGRPVNIGKCRICLGTLLVKCPTCNGASQVTCDFCAGRKVVPAFWTEFNNPKQKVKPAVVELKDGRKLTGRIQMRLGAKVYLKTEDGKEIELNSADIVSEKAVQ
jgi:hypothetical protein